MSVEIEMFCSVCGSVLDVWFEGYGTDSEKFTSDISIMKVKPCNRCMMKEDEPRRNWEATLKDREKEIARKELQLKGANHTINSLRTELSDLRAQFVTLDIRPIPISKKW